MVSEGMAIGVASYKTLCGAVTRAFRRGVGGEVDVTVPLGPITPDGLGDDYRVRALCHDMRQPLATILALSSTATYASATNDSVAVALRRVSDQASVLLEMIRSTLDNGSEPPEPEQVDVLALLSDAVAATALTFAGTLTMSSLDASRATVWAEPSMLRRAVVNLIDNATRAAGPGGTVRVTVVGTWSAVDVVVEDDGPGFGRIPSGSGIGLAVVRWVAAEYGGRLDFRAAESGGTRVRLRMPRATSRWVARS